MTKRIALLLVCLVAILVTAVHVAGQGPRQVTPEPPSVSGGLRSNDTTIVINQAMPAPAWALAERELLRLNAEGAAFGQRDISTRTGTFEANRISASSTVPMMPSKRYETGWNSPDEGVRNYVLRGPPEAFGNALLVTGDQGYTQVMRRQIDNLYAAAKVENGRTLLPRYYGDSGWYGHHDGESGSALGLLNLRNVEIDVYMWGLTASDLKRLPRKGETVGQDLRWIGFLEGGDSGYPLTALAAGIEELRQAAARVRADTNTYNFPPHATRGAVANPVSTTALINLTLGGNDPGGSTHGPLPLHTQVRHFDPDRRRAGLPQDVAALVERIRPEAVTLTLVNTSPFQARTVTVQTGAYAEHHAVSVAVGGRTFPVDAPYFSVRLAPGAGGTLTIQLQRYAHQPTLAFPWDRGWMVKK